MCSSCSTHQATRCSPRRATVRITASGLSPLGIFGDTAHSRNGGSDGSSLLNVTGLLEFSSSNTPSRVNSIPVTMNALAETLRGRREHASPTLSHTGPCDRFGLTASTGSDARRHTDSNPGIRLARTLGWTEPSTTSESSSARRINISPSPATTAVGSLLALERKPEYVSAIMSDRSRLEHKSSAFLRVGHLGEDPREAAKLMSKNSRFVEVDGITLPQPLYPLPKPGAILTAVARRNAARSSSVSDVTSSQTRARGGNLPPRASSIESTKAQVNQEDTEAGSRKCENTIAQCSPGGFAFSCDPKAQDAEIAMILGEKTCPIKHASTFYEHRSTLRPKRPGRARDNSWCNYLHVDAAIARDMQVQGAVGGLRASVQRSNSYSIGEQRPSSPSSLPASTHSHHKFTNSASTRCVPGNSTDYEQDGLDSSGEDRSQAVDLRDPTAHAASASILCEAAVEVSALDLIEEEKAADTEMPHSTIQRRTAPG